MLTLNIICQLLLLLSVISNFCLSAASTTARPVSKKDACDFWRNFSAEMNNFNRIYSQINYNCTYDPDKCTGADCTGAIRLEIPGIKMKNYHFCFGLQINHCANPISMHIYYLNGTHTSSYNIRHNDRRELTSLSMHTVLGDITPFLFFNLTRPVPHHILFGARAKVRVKAFGVESWPSDYQQDIIPNTEIPVTPCLGPASSTVAPTTVPNTCVKHPFPTHATTPGSPVVTKSTNQNTKVSPTTRIPPTTTMAIHSPTYNRTCDMSSLQSCSTNEVCKESLKDASKGICECETKHPFDRMTGLCHGTKVVPTFHWPFDVASTTVKTVIHNQPHKGNQSKSISKSAMIGGIVGGVVFLVVVLVVVVFLCRRSRSNNQYVGRLLLDNDDDTDNVI